MSTNEDLQRKIVEVLNEEIGSDLKNLHKLKELYEETRTVQDKLKEKLSLISSEAPTKIQCTLQDVHEFNEKLARLDKEFKELQISSIEHLKKSETFLSEISGKLDILDNLEHKKYYLDCIKIIEITSDKLQQFVQSNQDLEAIQLYNDLILFINPLQSSNCHHLVKFMNKTCHFWFELLQDKLKKEFKETLKMLQWPLISSNQEVLQTPPTQDVMAKFQQQFRCLCILKDFTLNDQEESSQNAEHPILSRFTPPGRALGELLSPLNKRFAYHFSGNRPTNRRDKPEWYLRQILQWIGDHVKFIETHVQPVYSDGDALLDFTIGLVQLAVEKLIKDTPAILTDDAIFAHTIGEVLSFETELRTSFNYPSSQPSPLLILTQPHLFSRWINLEKAFAVEKMDVLLSSDKAWSCVTGESIEEDDGVRLTQCVEGFLQMLLAITDRYKALPQPGHRIQFLDLQLDLLDEFRIRLLQLARQDNCLDPHVFSKTSPNLICPILNTVSAIISVLNDWSDLPFFLQLHTYKVQTETLERQAAQILSGDASQLPWLRSQTHSLADEVVEGSVFDGIIALFKRMQEDLLRRVVEAVMLEVKAKSQPYRLDKWASLPSPDTFIQPSLSPTGSAMLQAIALGLQWLQDSLASSLFREAWQKLAAQINEFLFEELVLQRQFNDGGTAQLTFDIQQNLIPLFNQFTNRPESYFRELKDALTLLNLTRPINLLLIDTLSQCVQMEDGSSVKVNRAVANAKEALKDQGVTKLSMEDALSVLRRRIL